MSCPDEVAKSSGSQAGSSGVLPALDLLARAEQYRKACEQQGVFPGRNLFFENCAGKPKSALEKEQQEQIEQVYVQMVGQARKTGRVDDAFVQRNLDGWDAMKCLSSAYAQVAWQMTASEYERKVCHLGGMSKKAARQDHAKRVIRAVRAGLPVPAEVLAEYPLAGEVKGPLFPQDLVFLARQALPCLSLEGYQQEIAAQVGPAQAAHRAACLDYLSGKGPDVSVHITFCALRQSIRRVYGFIDLGPPWTHSAQVTLWGDAPEKMGFFNADYLSKHAAIGDLSRLVETPAAVAERVIAQIPKGILKALFDKTGRARVLFSSDWVRLDPERLRVERDLADGVEIPLETLSRYPDLLFAL